MKLKKMTATFGKLQRQTLELKAAQSQSLGPLSCGANNITDAEFIKGIWGN